MYATIDATGYNETMRYTFVILMSFAASLSSTTTLVADAPAKAIDTIETVKKSLPYLEREGVAWMDKRGCVSCHQIPFMLWSLSAADEAGFDVDADKLNRWREWSTDVVNFVKPEQKKDVDRKDAMSANIDTMSAILLAVDDKPTTQWRLSFADSLVENQKKNGSWKSCGQLPAQKRPTEETTSVTAAWTALALHSQDNDKFDFDAAIAAVDATSKAKSTEWWASRLLLSSQVNDGRLAELRAYLLESQNDDGGWGWTIGEKSDAIGTGMALYSLRVTANDSASNAKLTRATKFLIETQHENGSWKVPGTKKSTRKRNTPTSNYWGTAWAVIGLLAKTPEPSSDD